MPKRVKYGKRTSRKRQRRGTYRKKPSRSISRRFLKSSMGFPRMLKFSHKYVEQIDLSSVGATATYQYRANGMFDPNITSTGVQPLYFDQLAAIYDHYVVIGSKIKYTIIPKGTVVQEPYQIVTWVNDDTTTHGTNMASIAAQKGSKLRLCQGGVNPDRIIVTNNWSAKKFFGGSILANNALQGTSSADPTEQSVYQINLRSLDGVSTVSVWIYVEIMYVAVWAELKDIAVS